MLLVFVDLYVKQIGQSSTVSALLERLQFAVKSEISYQTSLQQLMGAMDSLFTVAEQGSTTSAGLLDVPPVMISSNPAIEESWHQ